MLKSGDSAFGCQVIESLADNSVYQSYLVNCPDAVLSKLIVTCSLPTFDAERQGAFLKHAEWLSHQTFTGIGMPLKVDTVAGQPACLYPIPAGLPLRSNFPDQITPRHIVQLIKNIAVCLSAPHSAGLCHGNLSPDTLHLDGLTPFLADFSLAELLPLDYLSGVDPHYTSPEQVRGEKAGTEADLYSLGCLFYFLLTGQAPFSGNDAFNIAKQHLAGEFPRLPAELALLQPLIDSLVSVSPGARVTVDDLEATLDVLLFESDIDQCVLPAQRVAADGEGETPALQVDSAEGEKSDIVARVEERLKGHGGDFDFDAPVNIASVDGESDDDDMVLPEVKHSPGIGRFILVLLLGVVLGGGIYFLVNPPHKRVLTVAEKATPAVQHVALPDLDSALNLWRENDLVGAEAAFKKAIAAHHRDPRVYNNLAAFYAAQGNYEQARDYLEKALATNEEYATIYHNLGAVYAEMARGSYGRALQLQKSQQFISLPVFSSTGIVNLSPSVTKVVAEGKEETPATVDVSADAVPDVATEATIASAATVATKPVISEQQSTAEPVGSAAEKGVDATLPDRVEPAETPVIAAMDKINTIVETEDEEVPQAALTTEQPDSFLRRWAKAWSAQDVDRYLSFYGPAFIPPAGKTRQQWEAQRRKRLRAPKSIAVTLDNFELLEESAERAKIAVVQSYRSDLLSDKTRKVFNLQRDGKSWTIVRERSLGVIR